MFELFLTMTAQSSNLSVFELSVWPRFYFFEQFVRARLVHIGREALSRGESALSLLQEGVGLTEPSKRVTDERWSEVRRVELFVVCVASFHG